MKILLLITGSLDPSLCEDRFNLYPFIISKYLEDLDNEVIIQRSIPKIPSNKKNIDFNIDGEYDHIILIDKDGFSNRNINYLKYLKKISKYSVTTICQNNTNYIGEDALFYFATDSTSKKETIKLPISCEEKLFIPRQHRDSLYFLLDKRHCNDIYNDQYEYIFSEVIKIMENNISKDINFIIKRLIKDNEIEEYNIEKHTFMKKSFENYMEYIEELKSIDVYFATNNAIDEILLYELAMCNIIIIINDNYTISKKSKDLLGILTYNIIDIPWDKINDRFKTNFIRNGLIDNNHTWRSTTDIINTKMKEFESAYDKVEIIERKEKISKKEIKKNNLEGYVLLQSEINAP